MPRPKFHQGKPVHNPIRSSGIQPEQLSELADLATKSGVDSFSFNVKTRMLSISKDVTGSTGEVSKDLKEEIAAALNAKDCDVTPIGTMKLRSAKSPLYYYTIEAQFEDSAWRVDSIKRGIALLGSIRSLSQFGEETPKLKQSVRGGGPYSAPQGFSQY